MEQKTHLRKALMWHKVTELKGNGLNKTQIAQQVGIHRKTVGKYLLMDEDEFYRWISERKNMPKKLQPYYDFIKDQLDNCISLSAAQIEDRLKEHFDDLPHVHSKTIYNFVQQVRRENNLPKKPIKPPRQYVKELELPYGKEAQVDFGEYNMENTTGGRQKVYFFAMVLSRSRGKFVYFQSAPFTSSTAIEAHQLAFEYFGGVPEIIRYDQDRVFMVDENMGDLRLTTAFYNYQRRESFTTVFCRKADPESKGKVENVVRYVKESFLRGRKYTTINGLNQQALGWLKRTGNGKRHSTTNKVPLEEMKIEQHALLPIKVKYNRMHEPRFIEYKVLKDNTIRYKGNFYSLPVGTYIGKESTVLIHSVENSLEIYDLEKNIITIHKLSLVRGKYSRHSDHVRDKSKSLEENFSTCNKLLGNGKESQAFLKGIKEGKPRYLGDNLRLIIKRLKDITPDIIQKSLKYCLENGYYNANTMAEIAEHYKKESEVAPNFKISKTNYPQQAKIEPEKSNINDYESILNYQ
jgi:transposase